MRDQQKDVAHNLAKAAEFRKKADAATDARMKAAFMAVVREYLAKARALDPSLPRTAGTE
jgi:hypothetical protein